MPRAKKKERSLAMYEHIAALNSVEEMEQRFDVAKMLHAGKVYTTILQETGASSATVSRVNRMLNYGTGALEEVMERVDQQKGVAKEETETRRTE